MTGRSSAVHFDTMSSKSVMFVETLRLRKIVFGDMSMNEYILLWIKGLRTYSVR